MEDGLKKKFGLITAICMVVGIVIGSGVFFKAGKVLKSTDGNMGKCLLVVGAVGIIMVICAYVFATLAQRYEKVNGIVDYAEASLGSAYGYGVGWFMTTIYYPTLTACLAWISAQYTCILFGLDASSDIHLIIATFFLVACYAMNALSPKISGKFQVSTTVIKLIPLVVMAIVGTIIGLSNGMTVEAFSTNLGAISSGSGGIFTAMVAFAFAYEGWIIATSINSELKNAKKNLPIALIVGSIIVIVVYMTYFLGLTGAMSTSDMIASKNIPQEAFTILFGNPVFGTIAYVFVIISCLGTMNGLMLGCCRGIYSLSARDQGPSIHIFKNVDKSTDMPTNSSIFGLLLCVLWMLQWQLGFIDNLLPSWLAWENDELPIITIYAAYIPIFIFLIIKGKDLNPFKRFIMPTLASLCCVFMIYAAISSYGIQSIYYLIVFAIIMLIGFAFYRSNKGTPLYKSIFCRNK